MQEPESKERQKNQYVRSEANKILDAYLEDFYTATTKTGDVNRQLAFAGIAVIWVFNISEPSGINLPKGAMIPLGFFTIGLAIDLLHFYIRSVAWGIWVQILEHKINNDHEVADDHPSWFIVLFDILYHLKIIAVAIGYFLLISFIWKQ